MDNEIPKFINFDFWQNIVVQNEEMNILVKMLLCIFDKNFFVWKKFLTKISLFEKKLITIFDKNLDAWQKFRSLTYISIFNKVSIFDRNFDFLQKVPFLTKRSIFDKKFDKFRFSKNFTFDQNFDFCQKKFEIIKLPLAIGHWVKAQSLDTYRLL